MAKNRPRARAKKRGKKAGRLAERSAGKKKVVRRKTARARKRPESAKARKKRKPAPRAEAGVAGVAERSLEFAATEAGCLDQEVATALVFSCIDAGVVQLSTPLGTLFPSDVQRRGFCGCVFAKAEQAGATITPSDVPCSATNTVADVIDAISC